MSYQLSRFRRAAVLSAASAVVLGLSSCGPGGGPVASTGTPLTQQERAQGTQYHPQLISEFGGAITGPHADYVRGVAQSVSVKSGLSTRPEDFTVTLLNSPINNAFAVPGGYVYVTRQLIGLMNNEAELAGVLGHEVGHVAARHSAKRQAKAQQNQLLGVLGQVLSGVIFGNSALGQLGQQIATTAPQLATLSYSRDQELSADRLGIDYMKAAGYDPRAMASVLRNLAAQNALDTSLSGQSRDVPQWASTHPDPASRVQNALSLAGSAPGGVTNADTFMTRIDGLMYGDDPKQGVVEGRTFMHPDLRMAFEVPNGFWLMNGTRSVSISGQSGKGEFSTAQYSGNLENYIRSVFQAVAGEGQALAPSTIERKTINGIPAAYGISRVSTQSGQVDLVVYAYEFSPTAAYHFATIVPAGQTGVFSNMYNSVRRLSATEASAIKPRRIDVVTVKSGDSVNSLAARMAYTDAQVERFRVLNGLGANETVRPGQKVKIVVRASN